MTTKSGLCPTGSVPASPAPLPVVQLAGLRPDVLGNYLVAIGILRVAARKWPSVRGAWKDRSFALVGGPPGLHDLVNHLVGIARAGEWSSYERFWRKEQEKKDPNALACLAAQRTEAEAVLLAAHIVTGSSLWFNPLLGSGGNAGRRDFSKGWQKARDKLKKDLAAPSSVPIISGNISGFLTGSDYVVDEDWGAGSWFSQAVERANSGQTPTSKGQVSPWMMLLACEALPMFAGSPSRRLGSRARATAAFPFVTEAPAPRSLGEAGKAKASLWLPLWERPMTVPEIRWLFWRARAEVGGRGATTAAAFSAAVLCRGVDAGVPQFAVFTLASTTGQTFESRFDGIVATPRKIHGATSPAEGQVAETILNVFKKLPRDEVRNNRRHVSGYRAPLERALMERASNPQSPQTARLLLDAFVTTLDRLIRHQSDRGDNSRRQLSWRLLPCDWLPMLFGNELPSLEARLAMGAASLLASGIVPAFPAYRFGVSLSDGFVRHPERPLANWVWKTSDVTTGLANVVLRRLIDAGASGDNAKGAVLPFRAAVPVSLSDVAAWLHGELDEALLARWIGRLALFDWGSFNGRNIRHIVPPDLALPPADSHLAAYGLLRPLFDPEPVIAPDGKPLIVRENGAHSLAAARQIASLLNVQAFEAAFDITRRRYAASLRRLADIGTSLAVTRPKRLLAALLFDAPSTCLYRLAERFLRPSHHKTSKGGGIS
jgi:CRISPR-associated protein Csx17